jgi:hypothetical protein
MIGDLPNRRYGNKRIREGLGSGEEKMEEEIWMEIIAGAGVGKIRCFPRKQLPRLG